MEELYTQATEYLFSQLPMFSRIGAPAYKPGLDTSIALDNFFGNPHRNYKTIHIAGTNGKGSTSHSLAAILQSSGYKVGLYTSPHLIDFRERMRINGEMISKEEVIEFVDRWKASGYEGNPSFFELTMIMAFDWFANNNIDIAVIEVGMGGRLDSTNIITPIGCIITNISPDHTQFLGDTLVKIAGEKAGIIKTGVPVVIGEATGEVRTVFENKALEMNAPICFAEDTPLLKSSVINISGGRDCIILPRNYDNTKDYPLSFHTTLSGDYQQKNINTVLESIRMLRDQGLRISAEAIVTGMENVEKLTGLKGRWMITSSDPTVVCDTAHNIAGITYAMSQFNRLATIRGGIKRLVIGFVSDKDVEHIVDLLPRDAKYYTTRASVPRAMPAEDLHKILQNSGLDSEVYPKGIKEAFTAAFTDSEPSDTIYVGGSTFIVADYLSI